MMIVVQRLFLLLTQLLVIFVKDVILVAINAMVPCLGIARNVFHGILGFLLVIFVYAKLDILILESLYVIHARYIFQDVIHALVLYNVLHVFLGFY